jgi:hypothetical protein
MPPEAVDTINNAAEVAYHWGKVLPVTLMVVVILLGQYATLRLAVWFHRAINKGGKE